MPLYEAKGKTEIDMMYITMSTVTLGAKEVRTKNDLNSIKYGKIYYSYYCHTICYHLSLPLYLPAESISKSRIKVRVS